MNKYKCERCFYETNLYANMIRHINRKLKCKKRIESYQYSNDQLFILSILSRDICIEKEELEKYKKSCLLYDNKDSIMDILSNINCNFIKDCEFCSKEFSKCEDLKKHIILDCFLDNLNSNNDTKEEIKINNETNVNESIINITNNENSNNTNNTNNTNNITNNININVELKCPISFTEDWDLSEISEDSKMYILFQKSVYTRLLDKILQNNKNLNVIIDDINSKTGLVYNNDVDKYKEFELESIISKTMEKLEKHLFQISKETTEIIDKNFNEIIKKGLKTEIDKSNKFIHKKYVDYRLNNNNVKPLVNEYIKGVYHKNSEKAIEKLNEYQKEILKDGF